MTLSRGIKRNYTNEQKLCLAENYMWARSAGIAGVYAKYMAVDLSLLRKWARRFGMTSSTQKRHPLKVRVEFARAYLAATSKAGRDAVTKAAGVHRHTVQAWVKLVK